MISNGQEYNADVAQRIQLQTRNTGKPVSAPVSLGTGQALPVWDPTRRYRRQMMMIDLWAGGAGTQFVQTFSIDDLLYLWGNKGDTFTASLARPPGVFPKEMFFEHFFWTKTANPAGATTWRTEVYYSILQAGVSIYTIALLNEIGSGLTGAVTDFWTREPKKPIPVPLPQNTDFMRKVGGTPILNTDSYGIAQITLRIQTNDPLTNIQSMGAVFSVDY